MERNSSLRAGGRRKKVKGTEETDQTFLQRLRSGKEENTNGARFREDEEGAEFP